MADVTTLEQSAESGRPIEFYTFIYGPNVVRYTNYDEDLTFNSVNWESISITRNNPEISRDRPRTRLVVKLPTATEIGRLFRTPAPSYRVDATILRSHSLADSPPLSYVIYAGYVASSNYEQNGFTCALQLTPFNELFNRQVPRYTYQSLCNHVLYDGNCKVNRASFKHSNTVNAATNNETVLDIGGLEAAGGSSPARDFVGGYVQLPDGSDQRVILDQDGDQVTINLPFYDSVLGLTVDVYQGCDHALETCRLKFNNVINYGGFPYVPAINPFQVQQFTEEQ